MKDTEEPHVSLMHREGEPVPRWRWWISNIPYGAIVAGMFVAALFGGFLWLGILARPPAPMPSTTPRLHALAVVQSKVPAQATRALQAGPVIGFQLRDHYVRFAIDDPVKFQRVDVGDRVSVTYYVDRNGDYRIEDFELPLRWDR